MLQLLWIFSSCWEHAGVSVNMHVVADVTMLKLLWTYCNCCEQCCSHPGDHEHFAVTVNKMNMLQLLRTCCSRDTFQLSLWIYYSCYDHFAVAEHVTRLLGTCSIVVVNIVQSLWACWAVVTLSQLLWTCWCCCDYIGAAANMLVLLRTCWCCCEHVVVVNIL